MWEISETLWDANNKEATVEEVKGVNGGKDVCELVWRWPLFVWEEELLISLMEDLEGHRWDNYEDMWGWKLKGDGGFSVKSSCYLKLENMWMKRC